VTFNPANMAIPATGGNITASITAPAGCAWSSALHSIDFMHPTTATSGSGNGAVTYSVDANIGSARQGQFTLSIGTTQTQTIIQSASCVTGTDVSSQVTVTRGAVLSNFVGTLYTQQVTVKNISASTLTNVYLGLSSLTSQVAAPAAAGFSCGTPVYGVGSTLTLAPGQSATVNFQFTPGKSTGGQPPVYLTRVLTF
jgi:hypothetical protein